MSLLQHRFIIYKKITGGARRTILGVNPRKVLREGFRATFRLSS